MDGEIEGQLVFDTELMDTIFQTCDIEKKGCVLVSTIEIYLKKITKTNPHVSPICVRITLCNHNCYIAFYSDLMLFNFCLHVHCSRNSMISFKLVFEYSDGIICLLFAPILFI